MRNCFNPGPFSKAAKLCLVLLVSFSLLPVVVTAETAIQGSVINAPVKIENSANIAAGSDNKAGHSSLIMKDARVSGTVINSVQSKTAVNVAAGKRNVANQASIAISRGAVKGSVTNNVVVKSSTNLAAGNDNQANQSSVAIKNSAVTGNINNTGTGKNMVNVAAGRLNQANQSAVIIKNSSVAGTLSNSSGGNSKINMAVGTDNKADQGSVRIENSQLRGTVMNSASGQKSGNLAVGTGNAAAQASIVMDAVQMRGIVINNAVDENAVNAAVGVRNEASQSAIVVDGDQATNRAAIALPESTASPDTGGILPRLPMTTVGTTAPAVLPVSGKNDTPGEKVQKVAPHVPGQVVFLVDNTSSGLASLDRVARKYQLNVGERTVLKSLNRIMVVSSTAKDAADIADALKNEPGVYNSQPNYLFSTMSQHDPLRSMQNLVTMLDLPKVHEKVSGKNVTVAVVDTGVEIGHQDLRSRVIGFQNFITDSEYQGEIHGTAVAGIIGAAENDYGIVGVAPAVSLLALRACHQLSKTSAKGECFSTSLVRSLDAAISAKVNVVNLSLGADVNDTLLGLLIDSASEQGIVFAAPVGNDPEAEHIAFPASHAKVISIAGLDEQGNPLPNKRLAAMADAVAPATHLFVTSPGNGYNFSDGTSLASAAISGIIALSMEKKTVQKTLCLPRYNSDAAWSRQVLSCLGF